jgi:hypothetical protein
VEDRSNRRAPSPMDCSESSPEGPVASSGTADSGNSSASDVHRCTACDKSFKRQHLIDHWKQVHADWVNGFRCPKCDQLYIKPKKSSFRGHMRKYHGMTEEEISEVMETPAGSHRNREPASARGIGPPDCILRGAGFQTVTNRRDREVGDLRDRLSSRRRNESSRRGPEDRSRRVAVASVVVTVSGSSGGRNSSTKSSSGSGAKPKTSASASSRPAEQDRGNAPGSHPHNRMGSDPTTSARKRTTTSSTSENWEPKSRRKAPDVDTMMSEKSSKTVVTTGQQFKGGKALVAVGNPKGPFFRLGAQSVRARIGSARGSAAESTARPAPVPVAAPTVTTRAPTATVTSSSSYADAVRRRGSELATSQMYGNPTPSTSASTTSREVSRGDVSQIHGSSSSTNQEMSPRPPSFLPVHQLALTSVCIAPT